MFKAYKILFTIFFLYIKMTTNYYQINKEKLQKEARERYQNLSEEEKNKRLKKAREWYQKKKKKVVIRIFLKNKSKS